MGYVAAQELNSPQTFPGFAMLASRWQVESLSLVMAAKTLILYLLLLNGWMDAMLGSVSI